MLEHCVGYTCYFGIAKTSRLICNYYKLYNKTH